MKKFIKVMFGAVLAVNLFMSCSNGSSDNSTPSVSPTEYEEIATVTCINTIHDTDISWSTFEDDSYAGGVAPSEFSSKLTLKKDDILYVTMKMTCSEDLKGVMFAIHPTDSPYADASDWNGYWGGIQANKETEFSITTKITRDVESLRGWIQTKCNKQTSGKITVSDIKIVQKRAK